MKLWQQWITATTEWLRANPSARRWTAIGVIAIALIAVVANQSRWGARNIALFDSRELTSDEIGLMQVAFGKSGLNDYDISGSRIEVPRSLRGEYLKALSDHGAVPQDLTAHLDTRSSFDLFQTREQQRAQQINRKKQTIRDMVMQLRFVDRAIIDYDETRGVTPFDEMQRTAVVNVTPAGSRVLEMSEVKAIRDTVRGAVAGLRAEDITIIDTFASRSHTGEADSASEFLQPHVVSKMQAERKYENKIRSALTAYPGIRVNVEVTIDPVIRRVRDERTLDGDTIVVSRTVQRETSARKPSTRPSLANHRFDMGANGQAQVQAWNLPHEVQSETTESIPGGRFETTETAGLVVTSVNVSIGIPERCVEYFVERSPVSQNQSGEAVERKRKQVFEELQDDIRQKVGPLIPGDGVRQQQVVVTMDHEIPLTPSASRDGTASHWFPGLASILGWVAVGGLVLVILKPFGRTPASSTAVPNPAGLPADRGGDSLSPYPDAAAGDSLPSTGPAIHHPQEDGESGTGMTTQEEIRKQLDQWCRENPDAAAATIRQWLDRAG